MANQDQAFRTPHVEESVVMSSTSIVIGVMGSTGSGKSTLISMLTGQDVPIGHSLESCTSEVAVYCAKVDGRNVFFLDTPGLDNTHPSDTEVLKDLAIFLGRIYSTNVKLAGMIYLHRITDRRLKDSVLKNLCMFKNLCGTECMSNIVLATTMWDMLGYGSSAIEGGKEREKMLLSKPDFWKYMVQKGCSVFRHDGSKTSGWEMVHHILSKNSSIVLAIQRQIVDEGKNIDETDAGKVLQKELLESQEKLKQEMRELSESMATAIRDKDFESASQIQALCDELKARTSRTADELEKLKINTHRMLEDRDRHHKEELQMLSQQRKRQEVEMRAREQELIVQKNRMDPVPAHADREAPRARRGDEESERQNSRESLEPRKHALQDMRTDEERKIQIQMQREF